MISPDLKKWLTATPLTAAWRGRLDLALGIVITGAAVVALGSSVRPDPLKIAQLHHSSPIESGPPREPVTPGEPRQRPSIMAAAKAGNKEAVAFLLAHGADANENAYTPYAPIILADAYPEVTAVLMKKGAAEPTLENAVAANAPNAVARILAAHPSEAKTPTILRASATAMTGTAANKRLILAKLLDAGADLGKLASDVDPLPYAVRACDARYSAEEIANDCMAIVRMLLSHGARVTGDAVGAALSLDDANRAEPLETLLAQPIDPGVTAGALASASSIAPDDLKRITKMGVDWAWHDGEADAELPVMAAVRKVDRDLVRELLDAGAPVDVHFKDGTCALAEAIDAAPNNPDAARIVELLVTRGANVNRRFPDGRTPLFAAAEGGEIRVINFLIAHGARVNEIVLDDLPLDAADQHGNVPAARVLSAHGGHRAHPEMFGSLR